MFKINSVVFRITAVIIALLILSTLIACQPSETTIAITKTQTTTIPIATTTTETTTITTTETTTETTTVSPTTTTASPGETTTITIHTNPPETSTTTTTTPTTTTTSTTTTTTTTTTTATTSTPASFTGSFSGTWSGQDDTGEPVSGTFSFSIDEYGNIDGMFKGSLSAICSGAVDSFGNFAVLGNTSVHGTRMNIVWTGTLSRNGKKLSADGEWSCFAAQGTFSGNGTASG